MAVETRTCQHDGCKRTVSTDWASYIRAYDEGWFFQKDKTVWCPTHMPSWCPGWRARQKEKKGLPLTPEEEVDLDDYYDAKYEYEAYIDSLN